MNVLDELRQGPVAAFRPERSTLVAEGPDAKSWLNAVVTCDLGELGPGRGAWGLVLTKQGKILSDLFVVDAGERLLLGVAPGTESDVRDHLDRMLVMEDAEISLGDGLVWGSLHGSGAVAAAVRLVAEVPGVAHASIDWTRVGGAFLIVPADRLAQLRAQLGGGAHPVSVIDDAQYQTLRHERALPEFGADYDSNHTPHDASLDHRAVSWNKGCYVGQEVVCMQDMRGKVRRRLAPLEIDAPMPVERGASVLAEVGGERVGEVTSSAASADGQRALALARVKVAFSSPGTVLTVAGRRARVRALT